MVEKYLFKRKSILLGHELTHQSRGLWVLVTGWQHDLICQNKDFGEAGSLSLVTNLLQSGETEHILPQEVIPKVFITYR
jgi:hypothetical protein